MFFDPLYFIIVGPAILLTLWAQYKVKSAYKKYSQITASAGITGAELARRLLDGNNLSQVAVEPVGGELSDHYDPKAKVLRLSQGIYQGKSIAALSIAAHETGHAVQDKTGYIQMRLRAGLVPAANLGSRMAPILIIIGFFLIYSLPTIGVLAMEVGIVLFAAAVLFQLVTLPVEFNASRRALAMLTNGNYVRPEEYKGAKSVLTAAALTYVAAALAAITQLIYFILLSRRSS
ncbi:MAG TPA: zinc metallopeptidase [Actinobacteria bacterium]|nr:zinc metallopeptidase [Actinomycetes bacterium]HEX21391.1 zinc metallopeptidase [Actinomycetota bacterium]